MSADGSFQARRFPEGCEPLELERRPRDPPNRNAIAFPMVLQNRGSEGLGRLGRRRQDPKAGLASSVERGQRPESWSPRCRREGWWNATADRRTFGCCPFSEILPLAANSILEARTMPTVATPTANNYRQRSFMASGALSPNIPRCRYRIIAGEDSVTIWTKRRCSNAGMKMLTRRARSHTSNPDRSCQACRHCGGAKAGSISPVNISVPCSCAASPRQRWNRAAVPLTKSSRVVSNIRVSGLTGG